MKGWHSSHRLVISKDAHKFSVAHMTVFPDGSKEPLHGHNYYVTCALDLADISFTRFIDFSVIKQAVSAQCREWDERLLVPARCPFLEIVRRDAREAEFLLCGKRYVIPIDECLFVPVENIASESLAQEFARGFLGKLDFSKYDDIVTGIEVTVSETHGQSGVARLQRARPDDKGNSA